MKPKIRFKGFDGEWESSSISNTFTFFQNNTYSRAQLSFDGAVKNVHYGDVLIKYNDILDLSKDKLPAIIGKESTDKPLQDGDIILADTAEDETVGKAVEIINIGNQLVEAGLHTMVLRPKIPFASRFLGFYVNSNAFHDQLLPHIQGVKVSSISKRALSSLSLRFPKKEEQQAIASYFTHLDSLINSSASHLASLKQVKAASLQAMFPQEGETVPSLRFKGFEGEWKKVKLGDIGPVKMCKRILKEQTSDVGDVPFFKIGTFGRTPDAYISKELFESYKAQFSFPKKGEVLISAAGTIGRRVVYDGLPSYFQDSNIVWISNDERSLKNSFLYQVYGMIKWNTDASTIQRLYNESLLNTIISFPSLSEQQQIASYFTNLDNQIALQSQRLEKLKQIKAACLDKMFV